MAELVINNKNRSSCTNFFEHFKKKNNVGSEFNLFFHIRTRTTYFEKKIFFVMFFADMQAKEKVDGENKMRREEEELLAMEKINSNLNDKIGSLLQEIRTLREGLHGILR